MSGSDAKAFSASMSRAKICLSVSSTLVGASLIFTLAFGAKSGSAIALLPGSAFFSNSETISEKLKPPIAILFSLAAVVP